MDYKTLSARTSQPCRLGSPLIVGAVFIDMPFMQEELASRGLDTKWSPLKGKKELVDRLQARHGDGLLVCGHCRFCGVAKGGKGGFFPWPASTGTRSTGWFLQLWGEGHGPGCSVVTPSCRARRRGWTRRRRCERRPTRKTRRCRPQKRPPRLPTPSSPLRETRWKALPARQKRLSSFLPTHRLRYVGMLLMSHFVSVLRHEDNHAGLSLRATDKSKNN